jgi:hypothetical protein
VRDKFCPACGDNTDLKLSEHYTSNGAFLLHECFLRQADKLAIPLPLPPS